MEPKLISFIQVVESGKGTPCLLTFLFYAWKCYQHILTTKWTLGNEIPLTLIITILPRLNYSSRMT